jgi:hypothetical protein
MCVANLIQNVQCTIGSNRKISAIVINPVVWHQIIVLLEESEDCALVQALQSRLAQHPSTSGALRWQDMEQETTQ